VERLLLYTSEFMALWSELASITSDFTELWSDFRLFKIWSDWHLKYELPMYLVEKISKEDHFIT